MTSDAARLSAALEGRYSTSLRWMRITPSTIAEVYAMADDTLRALDLLERAVDHGLYPYKFSAEYCPFTVPSRGLPEFARIVDKAARRVAEFSA